MGATGAYKTTLLPHLINPVAIDFYHTDSSGFNGYIYWSDPSESYIGRVSFDGSNPMRIVNDVMTDSLAVDWISRNIYWIDYHFKFDEQERPESLHNFSVSVSRLDGRYQKKLITTELSSPRSIVVDPRQGYVTNSSYSNYCALYYFTVAGKYTGMIMNIVMLALSQLIWMDLIEMLLNN